jgi:dihydrofolate synthase / folylpolyglutamate synthase
MSGAAPGGGGYARLLARLDGLRTLGVTLGLDRVRAALDRLGNPQRSFVSVQIAGTNGKGSAAAFTEAILRAAGLRTGLFTSPHLCRFTERVRLDGREVDGEVLAALDPAVEATGIPLTYFETSAVLALAAMAGAGVEVAVLETGLGGRLDAVTAVEPMAATAITSVGLDHVDLLGGTLVEIAREKAGIVRPGVPLFVGPLPAEADREVARAAAAAGAPLRRYPADLPPPPVAPGLPGAHQLANGALAVALAGAAAAAARAGAVTDEAIAAGLAGAVWPGRLEWVAPDVLLDCAHNLEGAQALAAFLDGDGDGRAPPAPRPRALVVSMVRGKDVAGVMGVLAPRFDLVVATRSPSDRSLSASDLAVLVVTPRSPVEAVEDPVAALARARAFAAAASGSVVVAGSIFLVGALRAEILGERCDPGPADPMP